MSSSKVTWRWTLRQLFICLRPPPHLGFCLGVKILGSESGQIHSVKLLQYMLSNTTWYPHYTLYTYLYSTVHIPVLIHTRKGGGVLSQREEERGNRWSANKFRKKSQIRKFSDLNLHAKDHRSRFSIWLIGSMGKTSALPQFKLSSQLSYCIKLGALCWNF
jgi:hypothetical protein